MIKNVKEFVAINHYNTFKSSYKNIQKILLRNIYCQKNQINKKNLLVNNKIND